MLLVKGVYAKITSQVAWGGSYGVIHPSPVHLNKKPPLMLLPPPPLLSRKDNRRAYHQPGDDRRKLQLTGLYMHYIWEAPLETVAIIWLGIHYVGVSFLSAFAALALLVPMQVNR